MRVCSVCVGGAGLGSAIFCDVVNRFYVPGNRSSNTAIPVGLAAVDPLPPDQPMVTAVIDKKRPTGEPQYLRSIKTLTDTSQAEAMLRNGVTFAPQDVVVLSAPATWLARSLDLLGTKALYQERVKRLVVVDAGTSGHDGPALQKLLAQWPSPIVYCPRETGEALMLSAAELDKLFAWAPSHPVADAYRAYKTMPYDAPLHDVAAIAYAVKPESGFFDVTDGTLSASSTGALTFTAGTGNMRKLTVPAAKRAEALDALIAMMGTQPPPPARGRG